MAFVKNKARVLLVLILIISLNMMGCSNQPINDTESKGSVEKEENNETYIINSHEIEQTQNFKGVDHQVGRGPGTDKYEGYYLVKRGFGYGITGTRTQEDMWVKYPDRTYGCVTQEEYDKVFAKIEAAVEDFSIDDEFLWAIGQTLKRVPFTYYDRNSPLEAGRHETLGGFQKTEPTILYSIGKEDYITYRAGLGLSVKLGSSAKDPRDASPASAYDVLFRKRKDCDASAQVKLAIFDILGYDTQMIATANHAEAYYKIGGQWWWGSRSYDLSTIKEGNRVAVKHRGIDEENVKVSNRPPMEDYDISQQVGQGPGTGKYEGYYLINKGFSYTIDGTTTKEDMLVKYPGRTYGCVTQEEYDKVLEKVERTLNETTLPKSMLWSIDQTLDRIPYDTYDRYGELESDKWYTLYQFQQQWGFMLWETGRDDFIKVANGLTMSAKLNLEAKDSENATPTSAYDVLFNRRTDGYGLAWLDLAVLDVLGYDAQMRTRGEHPFIYVKAGTRWWSMWGHTTNLLTGRVIVPSRGQY
ncbi:hypothetical protein HYG86_14360 [Alkalicella caledoniensis]|uniref:Uncharacterized protein n=1 Tax=Alkalicella caledoniensis TaxID=2731377 RepID=A0A7G9WB03_ALKCA|nr:hypothetical protein [Alkalicella caledoniensis]QNO15865.1 hypothetical protein HYG86_14360 [Alkalicella caledoniensis]